MLSWTSHSSLFNSALHLVNKQQLVYYFASMTCEFLRAVRFQDIDIQGPNKPLSPDEQIVCSWQKRQIQIFHFPIKFYYLKLVAWISTITNNVIAGVCLKLVFTISERHIHASDPKIPHNKLQQKNWFSLSFMHFFFPPLPNQISIVSQAAAFSGLHMVASYLSAGQSTA